MACNQPPYVREKGNVPPEGPFPSSAQNAVGKILIVSNEPEAIKGLPFKAKDGSYTYNLYKTTEPVSPVAKLFRFFIWHQNATSEDIWLHLGLSLQAGTGSVAAFVVEDNATPDLGGMGVCLAKVQLYHSGPAELPVYVYTEVVVNMPRTGYWGALHVEQPADRYDRRGLFKLSPPDPDPEEEFQWANLTTTPLGIPLPTLVQPTQTILLRVAVPNGGAATLPFNLLLSSILYTNVNPPPGP